MKKATSKLVQISFKAFIEWISEFVANLVNSLVLMIVKNLKNILSDCHYSDVINSLLNAFRLKKQLKN